MTLANHAWGVMDMLAVTDFPDIRLKAAIQSADEGNILLIPREGGYLVRLYVDLGEVDPADRAAVRDMSSDEVIAIARRVLRPYTLDVKEVAWFSIYEVGQRVTDRFDDVPAEQVGSRTPRVFIAGDACHTHSAKAGQGMNVSMQDAFNLGWKLAAVLEGARAPTLLRTYSAERQAIAKVLIDFDKEWSKIMASPPKDPEQPGSRRRRSGRAAGVLREVGPLHGRRRDASTRRRRSPARPTHQDLAKGFTIGMRFHSAPVVRLADAKPMQLGHCAPRRRRLAALRLCRRRRPGRPGVTAEGALRSTSRSRRSAASRRQAPTSTASSTCARCSSRTTATSRSRTCRRCCCRARDASA